MAKSKLISVKQLRENMPTYLAEIAKGKSFTVLKRSKPVFLMTPILGDDEEEGWETIADFREINPEGVPFKDVLKVLREWPTKSKKS